MAWTSELVRERPKVKVNDELVEVNPEDPFTSTIKAMAGARGISRFKVIVDGEELLPEDAPDNFEGISLVEIQKYDEAG